MPPELCSLDVMTYVIEDWLRVRDRIVLLLLVVRPNRVADAFAAGVESLGFQQLWSVSVVGVVLDFGRALSGAGSLVVR